MASKRKKAPSPEQLIEAAALKKLFDERTDLSQEQFGDTYGVGTQGMVWQYLSGTVPLGLEAAIKFADGLKCEVADFSPRLAEYLERGRRNDPRAERYEIPDHMLHQLLGDFQELGKAKRQELLRQVRAAVLGDQELAKRGIPTDYPDDKHIERALNLNASRLSTAHKPAHKTSRRQMALFGRKRKP